MGLSKYGKPERLALEVIASRDEKARRASAAERADIYFDRLEPLLLNLVTQVFDAHEVRERIMPFLPLAVANNPLKRISDEIGRPIYATAPVRRVEDQAAHAAYAALAGEMNLNRQMDLVARLLTPVNDILLIPRYIEGRGMRLDVLTPSEFSVVPDPDSPTEALAYLIDVEVRTPRGKQKRVVVIDDESRFQVNKSGEITVDPVPHGLGRIPAVAVHRRARACGGFFDCTSGADLVAGTKQAALINALMLKLQKYQSHIQLVAKNQGGGMSPARTQILDESTIIVVENGELTSINLQATPEDFLRVKEHVEGKLDHAYGIRREQGAVDVARLERTTELMAVLRRAEEELFEVVQLVSRSEHPKHRVSAGATFAIDYGELHHRVDRKTQLEIRKEERSMGLRNVCDDILEDQPEVPNYEVAWRELEANMEIEAEFIRRRRALNVPEDATIEEPGQDPAENGKLGPLVRDGKITRDAAAATAKTGDSGALRRLALEVLSAD